ncbi:hypothetical protein ACOME3_001055 [Neoechinorhynchus agilis]
MENKDQAAILQKELSDIRNRLSALKTRANNTTFHDETRSIEPKKLSISSRRILKGHLAKVVGLQWFSSAISPMDSLVSAAPDGRLLVWDPMTGMKTATINLSCLWTTSCAASSDARFLASGSLNNVCSIHSLKDKTPDIKSLKGHEGYVSQCRFIEGSVKILTSSGDHSTIEWDIENEKQLSCYKGHIAEVLNIDVSSDERSFLTCSLDKSCKIWDRRTGKCEKTCEGHEKDVNACRYFPNELLFGSASDDKTCRLYDLRSDQYIATYSRSLISSAATSVCFSTSGRLIFAGYDDFKCRIWDTLKNSHVIGSLSHSGRVSCVEKNANGNAISTASWDGTIKIWN